MCLDGWLKLRDNTLICLYKCIKPYSSGLYIWPHRFDLKTPTFMNSYENLNSNSWLNAESVKIKARNSCKSSVCFVNLNKLLVYKHLSNSSDSNKCLKLFIENEHYANTLLIYRVTSLNRSLPNLNGCFVV